MSSINEITLEHSLSGFVRLHKNLIYIKNHNIVMRADDGFKRDKKSVILISGGGSGHENFPSGFVGKGMLDAAVCGNIFTSPSPHSCLASILLSSASDPNREILMIINNYTGDRLNFGLSIEMARTIHKYRHIKALTIDDDCAIDAPLRTGRRGLTAINIIVKVAGAMAAQGRPLDEIHAYCDALLCKRQIRSIGFSFRHDSINGMLHDIHIGYGIHGESGSLKLNSANCFNSIIDIMAAKLKIDDVKCESVAVLFNNLGGASEFIFAQFIKEYMERLRKLPLNAIRIYAGKFLTSLGAEGIGVSLLEIHDAKIVEYLDHACSGAAGHLFDPLQYRYDDAHEIEFHVQQCEQIEARDEEESSLVEQHEIVMARDVLQKVCEAINEEKIHLNVIDIEFGDGDTGSTLSRGSEAILGAIEALNFSNPHLLLIAISDLLMRAMGGSSGAVFSIFFQCASNAFGERNEYSIRNFLSAISLGMEGIMRYGKAEFGDRTLLDSLKAGYDALKAALIKEACTLNELVEAFADGCHDGAESTKHMRAKSGRAAYSSTDENENFEPRYVDSGAYAIDVIARTMKDVLQGRLSNDLQ